MPRTNATEHPLLEGGARDVAAAVTAVALVIAFVPTGRQRAIWGTAAALFSLAMALSRTYLAAHWLSDAVAGVLLGVSCALVTALAVQAVRDATGRRRSQAGARSAVPT